MAAQNIGQRQEAIIQGQPSDASQDSTVLVKILDAQGTPTGYFCSGVLIAPNVLVTARHCVSNGDMPISGTWYCSVNGNTIQNGDVIGDQPAASIGVYTGPNKPIGLPPTAIGKKIFSDGATNLCNHDLALVLLDHDIPGAVIAPVRLGTPPVVGEALRIVGWGTNGMSQGIPKMRQQLKSASVIGVGSPRQPDDPNRNAEGTCPNELLTTGGACSGDSGAGAFSLASGAVLGVFSRFTYAALQGTCKDASDLYTRMQPFADLFARTFAEAGHMPWLEGKPPPKKFGQPCTAPADCDSNACISQIDTSKICSFECSNTPCPMGYECIPVSREHKACSQKGLKIPPAPSSSTSPSSSVSPSPSATPGKDTTALSGGCAYTSGPHPYALSKYLIAACVSILVAAMRIRIKRDIRLLLLNLMLQCPLIMRVSST